MDELVNGKQMRNKPFKDQKRQPPGSNARTPARSRLGAGGRSPRGRAVRVPATHTPREKPAGASPPGTPTSASARDFGGAGGGGKNTTGLELSLRSK